MLTKVMDLKKIYNKEMSNENKNNVRTESMGMHMIMRKVSE